MRIPLAPKADASYYLYMSQLNPDCGVYSFVHVPTGRRYIGSSVRMSDRERFHKWHARKGTGYSFHFEMRKLGIENFTFEVVEICPSGIRFEREEFYIAFHNSVFPNGFNIIANPSAGWNYELTAAANLKRSLALKGRIKTDDERRRLSIANIGKRHSDATIQKMRLAQKGRIISESHREKLRKALTGHVLSDETKAKISASLRARGKQSKELPLSGGALNKTQCPLR